MTGLPRLPEPPFRRAVPTTPADRAGARVDCFPRSLEPSPNGRRVGIRIVTFEACSGFTLVTARRIAQPPKVTFVTRLRPSQLPNQAARQLPDLSTIIRVESSSTGVSRLRGALPATDLSMRNKLREQKAWNSLNQLISLCDEERRHFETKRLGGLEIDHQLELRRLLDGQVGGLGALEDLVHVGGGCAGRDRESSARKT